MDHHPSTRDPSDRRQSALGLARSAIAVLREIGVEARIIGSLASGKFGDNSDIDFLIISCPQHLKYAIEGIVEDQVIGFQFDVVYLDEIPSHKREQFIRHAEIDPKQLS